MLGFRGRPAGLRRQAAACREAACIRGLLGFCGGLGSHRPRPTWPGRPRPAGGCPTLAGHGLPRRQGRARPRPARVFRGPPAGLAQAVAYWAGQAAACGPVPDPSRPRPAGKGGPRQATAC
eukprot:scaffold6142_cov110-Isochrysis_galbana.AAC.3